MATKKDTATTLERQAAADSDLEELPEFGAVIINGHILEGGVRPSERCGTPSPLGIGCTFKDEHAGRHSWQPEPVAGAEPEQATLPGTPEPAQDEFSIPYESQFNGADFQSAPGIKAIAEGLINSVEEFTHLRGIEIRYFWKRRGGLKGGNPRLGNLQRPTGLAAYALGRPVFALWLAADHCRDVKLTPEQTEALIFQQLCRAAVDPDDHSAYRIVGPDVEMFALELSHYGLWSADLREAASSLRQLPLDQELDLPALAAGDDEDDEGEVDE